MQIQAPDYQAIFSRFRLEGSPVSFTPITFGHINDTIRVACDGGQTYILQRINTNVFKDPDALMENILHVTAHLAASIRNNGGDPQRETLTVFPTLDGKPYYRTESGDCMRVYNYVRDTYSLQEIENPDDFSRAGEAFGRFQQMLADYPIETLHETIARFHDTASRFADLQAAAAQDAAGRKQTVAKEIDFCLQREADTHVLLDLLSRGELPLRVTHNDTKLNNVLFDNRTHKGICVVDLDTVMPGLSLYDFGDSIRFGANTAAEDEKDLSKVSLSPTLYRAYTDGYLRAAGSCLTPCEIEYLPFSAKLMTLECGMRFLTDYLNGDTYFHTAYPEHNLDRCRTQFALVADIENKFGQMQQINAASARAHCQRALS